MKVPKARKLKSGNWTIQLRLGGESISITCHTEKQCIKEAELAKAEYRNGQRNRNKPLVYRTLEEGINSYIESRENILSPSTIRGYRAIQFNRFQSIMQKPMNQITGWQKIINSEAKLCNPKTLKNAYLFICSVLRENGIPLERVTLPQIVRHERPFLDPEDIPIFLEAIQGEKCEMGALLALHGLRRSELLAVTKDDNIKGNSIIVKGATVLDEHHQLVNKPTNKNISSQRTIPIMIPRLKYLIASTKSGHLVEMNPDVLRNRINRCCMKRGLPKVGIHGLRHSFASLAYHLGLSEQQTMELGGWSDATTMRKIYTHLAQKDRAKAINKMTSFYKNANKIANKLK